MILMLTAIFAAIVAPGINPWLLVISFAVGAVIHLIDKMDEWLLL